MLCGMLKVFYINRDADTGRRAHIEAEVAAAGLTATRMPAVEGADVPPPLREFFFTGGEVSCGLRPGQIGCSASHLLVMQRILDDGVQAALVLEDDACLAPDAAAVLAALLPILPAGWDIVRLCRATKRAARPLAPLPGGRRLVRFSRVPVGAAGYLVSASGAAKLAVPRKACMPNDVEIAHPWTLGLDVYGVEPPLIFQERSGFASTIGKGRAATARAVRRRMLATRMAFNIRKLGFGWWLRCWLHNAFLRHFRKR